MANFVYVDNSNVWIEGMRVSAVEKGLAPDLQFSFANRIFDHDWRVDFGKLFEFAGGKDIGILRFWHRAMDDAFYGVQWEYERGRPRTLVRFERESGRPEGLCQIDSSSQETVSPTLDCLITSAGSVFGLSDGRLVNCLAFPERDYPE